MVSEPGCEDDTVIELGTPAILKFKERVEERISTEVYRFLETPEAQMRINEEVEKAVQARIDNGVHKFEYDRDLERRKEDLRELFKSGEEMTESIELQRALLEKERRAKSSPTYSGYDPYGLLWFIEGVFGEISSPELVDFELLGKCMGSILSECTDREKRIVEMRFGLYNGQKTTLKAVGEEFHLTNTRIGDIEKKVMRRIRHPSRSRMLRKTLFSNGLKMNMREMEDEMDELKSKVRIVSASVKDIMQDIGGIMSEVKSSRANIPVVEYEKSIDDLSLTVRAYQALRRGGIRTIGQLCETSITVVSHLRNVGVQTLDEIVTKLGARGYKLSAPLENDIERR